MTAPPPALASSPRQLASWDSHLGIDAVCALPATEDYNRVPKDGSDIGSECTRAYAAVATYALGDKGMRHGKLSVVSASAMRASPFQANDVALHCCAEADHLPGLLDVAFLPVHGAESSGSTASLILAAGADGTLLRFSLSRPGSANPVLVEHTERCRVAETGTVCLSLHVPACEVLSNAQNLCAVSDSAGAIHIFAFSKQKPNRVARIAAHGAEAWTCALSCVRNSRDSEISVFSGGDDGVLAGWRFSNLSTDREDCFEQEPETQFRLRQPHDGVGVTSLFVGDCVGGIKEHRGLLSGGYDDTLRLWDRRYMKKCVSRVQTGGGVWRIARHPTHLDTFLLACMYNGFRVVRCGADGAFSNVAEYREHKSLAYGASWLPGLEISDPAPCSSGEKGLPSVSSLSSGKRLIALTGSFYDHALHLWQV